VSVELRQRSKDGSWHNVEVTARNLLDNPLVGGVVATHQDVTARREAEKALRQREQEYVSLIERSPDGVAVVRGTQFLFANRRAGEIFGLDPTDFVGDKIPELMTGKLAELVAEMPEEERLRITENISRIAQGDQVGHQMYEVTLKRNTGQRAWIEINASPIQYKGEPVQLAFIRDVTKRKEDEQALKDREQKLQEALQRLKISYEELSTPVVQVWDQIIALPLIGVLDTTRVQQVMDVMLDKIMETRAQVVILDVTGVVSVDTQVANHLLRAAQSVRLLGAECVITGIKPDVAHTMVSLGIDMSRLDTKRDLHEALRYGLNVVGHDVAEGDRNLPQAPG
jgi:PAS domain S-box-containing protein